MQSNRQPKWDWDTHFDWMLDLYKKGEKIPQIHKAIVALECENFRPCLRAVYDRFQAAGYDTGHDRGSRSSQGVSPTHREASGTSISQQQFLTAPPEEVVPRAPRCVPRVFTPMKAFEVLGAQTQSPHFPGFIDDGPLIVQPFSYLQNKMEGQNMTATQANPESWNHPLTFDNPAPKEFKIPGLRDPKKSKVTNTPAQYLLEQNLRDAGLPKKPNPQHGGKAQHGGGRTRHPDQDKDSTFITKIRSLASSRETKNSVSKSRANQPSPFTNRDSGLYSGRRTPSSRGASSLLHFRDSGVSQVGSFTEMNMPTSLSHGASSIPNFRDSGISQAVSITESTGPYRVVCQTQHEPNIFPNQYRRRKPCIFCRYSTIHNLAWGASNLRLQEFEDELSFEALYDFQALDAAKNTALHYAAAAGASPGHLKALILAGVPPYQQNTAKQNFLHCLQPRDTGIDGWDPDCLKVNLIQLLDLLDTKVIFGQQDNDGQTVLRVLTSHVTDLEERDQIIEKFTGSGFCLDIVDRFGRRAVAENEHGRNEEPILEEIDEIEFATLDDPMWFTDAIDYPDDAGDDTMGTSSLNLELLGASSWNNAFDAIVKASESPHSVDMATKDTVLHALSKVNVQLKGSMRRSDIMNYLRDFVSKGVNLNWHNADGQTPLTAFICNKCFRGSETGATMAKYMDIILWKDDDHTILNDINVDMMNRRGATALHEAVVQALSDPVRSLLEAGANPNARLHNDPREPSVLQATLRARDKARPDDHVRHHMFAEVISHLEHAGAVVDPTSLEERGRCRERSRSS